MPASEDRAERAYTFPRAARLKRRRLIRPLFDRDRDDVGTVVVGCIRLLFRTVARAETGYDIPVQIGFAPGRTPSAVVRNRVRRLLREGYRVHQHFLIDRFLHRPDMLTVMVLFRGRVEAAATCIPRDLPKALQELAVRFEGKVSEGDGPPSSCPDSPTMGSGTP